MTHGKEAKQGSWTKANFHDRDRKLWQNPDNSHEAREVLVEPDRTQSIRHAGQDTTTKNID